MTDKPNFVLVPDDEPPPPARTPGVLARLRTMAGTAVAAAASAPAALLSALSHAEPPAETGAPARPRLVFAVDATASREPAWAAARQVTDALVKALPGELDVALAVHGGSRCTPSPPSPTTPNAARPRRRHGCHAGLTRLLPILSAALSGRASAWSSTSATCSRRAPAAGSQAGGRDGRAGHQADRAARYGRSRGAARCRGVLGPCQAHRRLRAAVRRQRLRPACATCCRPWRSMPSAARSCCGSGGATCPARWRCSNIWPGGAERRGRFNLRFHILRQETRAWVVGRTGR